MRCAIWYDLYNLKNVKNTTRGGVSLLVKLQASACNFTKSNTRPRVFFTFLKLYKCYQTAQRITYENLFLTCVFISYHLKTATGVGSIGQRLIYTQEALIVR